MHRNRRLSLLLTLVLIAWIVPQATLPARADLDPIRYLDEAGVERTCTQYACLNGGGAAELEAGWYVVNTDIDYTGTVTLKGDVNLILADGKTMNVGTEAAPIDGCCFDGSTSTLTVYGQADGTGELRAYNDKLNYSAVNVKALTVNGGRLTADAVKHDTIWVCNGDLTVNGGTVNVTARGSQKSAVVKAKKVVMNGGEFKAVGWRGISGNVALNYKSAADSFRSDTIVGSVTVGDNMAFTDGSNRYSGTLTNGQKAAIAGRELVPAYVVDIANGIENGMVSASPALFRMDTFGGLADENRTVTLTVTPETGFELAALTVAGAGGDTVETAEGDGGGYVFTMPAESVSVSAAFAKTLTAAMIADIPAQNYTGSAIEPALTVKDGETILTKDTHYTVTWSDNTNAGTATAVLTGKGGYAGTVQKTFVINRVDANVIAPTGNTLTYNGDNQALVAAGDTTGGRMQYSLTENGTYSEDVPVAKNAGRYTVYYKVVGDNNHKDSAPESVTASIDRKEITVSGITANGKTYDGTTSATLSCLDAAFDGICTGDTLSVSAVGAFENANAGDNKTVNISGLTLGGASVDNYQLATSGQRTAAASIGKAALSVAARPKAIIYGDAPANDGVTCFGFVNGETSAVLGGTLDYDYTYAQYDDVGSYDIVPKGLTADNYELSFVPGTLTVEQKEVGLSWSGTELTFNGSAQAPAATATGTVNNDVIGVTVGGAETDAGTGLTATANALTGGKAGNYKLPATGLTQIFSIGRAAARTLADVTLDKVVGTKNVTASVAGAMPADAGTLNYEAGTASVTNGSGSTVNNWSVDASGTVTASVRTAVGSVITLPVTIRSANYEPSEIRVVVTIVDKSDANVTIAGDDTKTYGDAAFTLTADAANTGENAVWTWKSSNENVAAVSGTGEVTIVGGGTTDITAAYESDVTAGSASLTLTVNPRSVPVPAAASGLKWTGSEQTGVAGGEGCSVTDGAATHVGDYTATATLSSTVNYQWSDGTTAPKSIAWSIGRAVGPAAPTGLMGVAPTADGGCDGRITGVTADMEYSADGVDFAPCSGTEAVGLAAGTYFVRMKKTATHEAGAAAAVNVPVYSAPPVYTVTVTNDGHGAAFASPVSAGAGAEITLTTTANAGYRFKAWQVVSGGVSITGNKFTLGAENVTVRAVFERDMSGSGNDSGGGRDRDNDRKTETRANADGSRTEIKINADGSRVETTIASDGKITTVSTAKDGEVTTKIKTADGSAGTTHTHANGSTESAEAAPSEKAVSNAHAKGVPVVLAVEIKAAPDSKSAAEVHVSVPASVDAVHPMAVEIPCANLTVSTVAVAVEADGGERIITSSVTNEHGVIFSVTGDATIKLVDNARTFNDIVGNEWCAGNIAWAASHGIMNGVGDGNFDKDGETTQGMMEQILYNIDGNELTAPAKGENWWGAADAWAEGESGVTAGVAMHDPALSATREVDVLMMYNYAKSKGFDASARADLSAFSDADGVSTAAREAMAWAVAAGVINGTTDERGNVILDAQGVATRGQIAAIIQRFCEKMAK